MGGIFFDPVFWVIEGHVLIICFVIFVIFIGAALIQKVWSRDASEAAHHRRLNDLVRRANKGDMQALEQCRHEPDIKVRLVFKDGRWGTRCKVSWSAIYRAFGHST